MGSKEELILAAHQHPELRSLVVPLLRRQAAKKKEQERDVPKYVKELAEQITKSYKDKGDDKGTAESKGYATAWSVYCRYKSPGSEHCHRAPSDYFPKSAAKLRFPRSKYDRISRNMQAFSWATPARNVSGETPMPWRVVQKDEAYKWLRNLFPANKDLYVDYHPEKDGRMVLWVGLRDNRDQAAHAARIEEMREKMKAL
jgi:hypothetical protein